MNARIAKPIAALTVLSVAVVGCAKATAQPTQVHLGPVPSSALVVVVSQPVASADIAALIDQSARAGEHLEVTDPTAGAGAIVSSIAPKPPVKVGPILPTKLASDPSRFQLDTYRHQSKAYQAQFADDLSELRHTLAERLRAWSARVGATLARKASRTVTVTGPSLRVGLAEAMGFFSSLAQAQVNLGPRRVVVVFETAATTQVVPLRPGSLSGSTVVIANFDGSETAEAKMQADLLQAGAARAIVLVPAAASELAPVITAALRGQSEPAPIDVHFPLNRASLQPAARAKLQQLILELTRAYPNAPASILGFADPLGSQTRNSALSLDRALAVKAFLVSHGIVGSRLFSAGYGAGLPAAPSSLNGAQPLDRRVIVIIDPVT